MKKNIYILLCIFSLLYSCDDALEFEPHDGFTPDKAYATLKDCENAIKGVYFRGISHYGGSIILIPDAYTDNLISFSLGRQTYSSFRDWNISTGNSYVWNAPYTCIYNANTLINNIDKTSTTNEKAKNHIKGEAIAMRALMHFELVRMHGITYHKASDSDLGVPYVKVTNSDNLPARNTVKEVYTDIVKDLDDAYKLMDATYSASLNEKRLRKSAVAAIQAKVYLTMHEYDKAIVAAKDALTSTGLAKIDKVEAVWRDQANDGVIFKLPITDQNSTKIGDYYNQHLASGIKSEFVLSHSFAQMFQANDIRTNTYISKSEFNGVLANHVIKHQGRKPTDTKNKVDLKILRAADMYLIISEANMRKSSPNETEALKYLNDFRKERYSGFIDGAETGADLLNETMRQRRIEMAFEYDRFFTIKRLGLSISRDDKGDAADGTGRKYIERVLAADDYRFNFPIPTSEMDANPNMIQVKGYTK